MIIRHFDVVSVTGNKPEAYTPLVVDGNRVLSFSVSLELVESITRRHQKVIQTRRQVDVLQLSPRSTQYIRRQSLGPAGLEQCLCVSVCEALDHISNVIHHVTVVKLPVATALSRAAQWRRFGRRVSRQIQWRPIHMLRIIGLSDERLRSISTQSDSQAPDTLGAEDRVERWSTARVGVIRSESSVTAACPSMISE